jgi:hypothetical protein
MYHIPGEFEDLDVRANTMRTVVTTMFIEYPLGDTLLKAV